MAASGQNSQKKIGVKHQLYYFQVMAITDKTKLLNEIAAKIQALNLLLSTLKEDRSRKPETLAEYRKQYHEMLDPKSKNGN